MKSTRSILKGNEDLLENEVVNKLVEYISELEDELIEFKQLLYRNKENILLIYLKEIKIDLNKLVKEKKVNHKEVLLRFNENLNQFFLDNNI